MNTPDRLWQSKVIIRFSDCDPFNHLNNARYIAYFINAREDHIMANLNFNIYQYAAENGFGWVVSKNQIAYLRPAFLMETVIIESTLLKAGEREVFVEMKMWNESKTKLKSVLWSNFVHINMKTQRPENHPQNLMDMFKPLERSLPQAVGFDERVEQLKALVF
jgi:YbgC/YbaW family acyl-CoA thioester hydrolase